MRDQITKILFLIDRSTWVGLAGLFLLMFVAAVLEMAGIGMFLPLLQLLTAPEQVSRIPVLGEFYDSFGEQNRDKFLILFCLALFGFFVLKSAALAAIIFIQNRFVTREQAVFARALLRHYLAQPYVFHLQRNTMELVRNVTMLAVRLFVKGLLPILQFTMELLIVSGILIVLLVIDPWSTLAMALVMGGAVTVFYLFIRHRIQEWGRRTVQYDGEMLIWINQALGAIKETKLYRHEDFFCDAFGRPAMARAGYLARSATAPHLPRLFIEAVAVGAMALLVAFLFGYSRASTESIIPILGLFAVAAMRMLPSLSRMVSAVTTFRENTAAVNVIHADLVGDPDDVAAVDPTLSPECGQDPLPFRRQLRLEGLAYRYPGASETVLSGIDLVFERGQSIALVGRSGAGKTTLVDLILGLLEPVEGRILADGIDIRDNLHDWQRHIGYIPQEVFLTDDTLRHNIALGRTEDEIDEARLQHALTLAQLDLMVAEMPRGLDTMVGERGSHLSGGQRQRVGIARAVYTDPEILVMDEATSALDNETENHISQAVAALVGETTVIIIAHRLATVRRCDTIVLLDQGRVKAVGSFEELAAHEPQFARLFDLSDPIAEDMHQ